MPSPAYARFVESMNIGYIQWHDGTGYDLQALAELEAEERAAVEAMLIAHLKDPGDWRDVEALAALDSSAAREAVIAACEHRDVRVRREARAILLEAYISFLGYGVQTSPGLWTLTFATAGRATETCTFFAVAQDSFGVWSDPLATTDPVL